MRHLAPSGLIALLFCGCAATAGEAPRGVSPDAAVTQTSSGYDIRLRRDPSSAVPLAGASAEQVWRLLPAVYDELGIPLRHIDPATRTLGNRSVTSSRVGGERIAAFLRCGSQGMGPGGTGGYQLRLSVLTTVEDREGGAAVRTEVNGTAAGATSASVTCASSGALERRVAERLQTLLETP